MQKSNKLIIILTISIFLFAMSSVHAEDVSNDNMTQSNDMDIVDIEDTDNNEVICILILPQPMTMTSFNQMR